MAQAEEQASLRSVRQHWTLTLSRSWDVLGPFPIHAREQHFISPSYPLNLSQPINYGEVWPSSYADNGVVRWSNARLSEDGIITVTFPEVRWGSLRATEGWAALQHHAVLRGTITLTPPDLIQSRMTLPRILAHLKQGSYFTILPIDGKERKVLAPEWYTGNVYDMERALPRVVDLPTTPDLTGPTQYEIFISSDYEIRLFGDPRRQNVETPIQVIGFSMQVENESIILKHEPTQDVLCDFVDGLAFGETIGLGFRSATRSTVIRITSEHPEVKLKLRQNTTIAESQLRIIPLIILQCQPFHGDSLNVLVTISHGSGQELQIPLSIPIRQRNSYEAQKHVAFKATYLYGVTMPTAFLAMPPINPHKTSNPPILALHGAGVDIIEHAFWPEALPPSNLSWTVIPSGRTSWGLDWHGPSAQDAWDCVDALAEILKQSSEWKATAFEIGTPVIVIGHSNGGQGAWYIGLRYPDKILGLVPSAGYIKSQAYVPLGMSRSAHFIDPLLRAILETSLTPDDNDLFLTNIVNKPVLVVHGGDDDNVPVWHGRESFSTVKTWAKFHGVFSDIIMKEDKGQPHFYPTVFNNSQVQDFIHHLVAPPTDEPCPLEPFTLTVFRPEESGSLNGWKIEEVKVLGRLARLTAFPSNITHDVEVRTSNVRRFSISRLPCSFSILRIDGDEISIKNPTRMLSLFVECDPSAPKWRLVGPVHSLKPSPPTRLQFFLSGKEAITFIQAGSSKDQAKHFKSLAFRLAHDLHIYHRLDSEIVQDQELIHGAGVKWPQGNIVVTGSLSSPFVRRILLEGKTPLGFKEYHLTLNGRNIPGDSHTGIIFLHPHPVSPNALMMLIVGESPEALERAARLFPIRTGVTVPSWTILGPEMDELGAAGIFGAGVWGPAWAWNDGLSWCKYL